MKALKIASAAVAAILAVAALLLIAEVPAGLLAPAIRTASSAKPDTS